MRLHNRAGQFIFFFDWDCRVGRGHIIEHFLLYNMGLYLHPGGAPRSQSQYFSNGNFSMKKFTNPKTNTISIWKTFKVWGYGTADHQKSIVLKFLKSPQKWMKQFVEREQWILKIQNESLRVKSGLTFFIFILQHGQMSAWSFISELILQKQAFHHLEV